jgi:hypothetical protein
MVVSILFVRIVLYECLYHVVFPFCQIFVVQLCKCFFSTLDSFGFLHPGSFGGVDKLYKFVRKKGKYVLGKAKIRQWLETQETFGFHRQIKRKFSRRKVIVPFIEYQWDADTAVMKSFTKDNDGYGYLLLAIDVFSHYNGRICIPLVFDEWNDYFSSAKFSLDQSVKTERLLGL